MRYMNHEINGAIYTIYEDGRVVGKNGKEIKQRPNADGYASFTAGAKGNRICIRTHRIVGKLFIENPNGLPELDHMDSNRMNPAAWNLEWVSHKENVRRAWERGNHNGKFDGAKNPRAKLTENMVRRLRQEYASGVTQKELSVKYNISWSTVHNVVNYLTWKCVV
jgi:hypothetical protein